MASFTQTTTTTTATTTMRRNRPAYGDSASYGGAASVASSTSGWRDANFDDDDDSLLYGRGGRGGGVGGGAAADSSIYGSTTSSSVAGGSIYSDGGPPSVVGANGRGNNHHRNAAATTATAAGAAPPLFRTHAPRLAPPRSVRPDTTDADYFGCDDASSVGTMHTLRTTRPSSSSSRASDPAGGGGGARGGGGSSEMDALFDDLLGDDGTVATTNDGNNKKNNNGGDDRDGGGSVVSEMSSIGPHHVLMAGGGGGGGGGGLSNRRSGAAPTNGTGAAAVGSSASSSSGLGGRSLAGIDEFGISAEDDDDDGDDIGGRYHQGQQAQHRRDGGGVYTGDKDRAGSAGGRGGLLGMAAATRRALGDRAQRVVESWEAGRAKKDDDGVGGFGGGGFPSGGGMMGGGMGGGGNTNNNNSIHNLPPAVGIYSSSTSALYSSRLHGSASGGASRRRGGGGGGGGRSTTGGGDASIGTYGGGSSSANFSDSVTVQTHGVSSILESMGLGPDASAGGGGKKGARPGELDGFLASAGRTSGGGGGGRAAAASATDGDGDRRKKPAERMAHLRAGFLLFGLVGLVFAAVQLTVVVKHDRAGLRSMRGVGRLRAGGREKLDALRKRISGARGGGGGGGGHEEGVDRPVSLGALAAAPGGAVPQGLGISLMGGAGGSGGGGPTDVLPAVAGAMEKKQKDGNDDGSSEGRGPVDVLPPAAGNGAGTDPEGTSADIHAMVKETMPGQYQYAVSDNTAPHGKGSEETLGKDTPLFWHVPRSGGRLVVDVMEKCRGVKHVDTVESAQKDGLPPGTVVVTSFLHRAMSLLLDSEHHGRLFTLLRHPVHRAASTYSTLHKSHKIVSKMSFEEYAKSKYVENNWMVRYMTGKADGEITEAHLDVAKEVLRKKFVVGLLDQKAESVRRFEEYFGWDGLAGGADDSTGLDKCRADIIDGNGGKEQGEKGDAIKIKEGSQAWNLLVWQNKLDMKLYEYGQQLFARQGMELFAQKPPADKKAK